MQGKNTSPLAADLTAMAHSLTTSVASMEKQLKTTPLVLQIPVGQAQGLKGVIDLVNMEMITWEPGSNGSQFSAVPLVREEDFSRLSSLQGTDTMEPSLVEKAVEERGRLTDQVSRELFFLVPV